MAIVMTAAAVMMSGCGGALARNSPVDIRFEQVGGGASMNNLQWLIVPDDGPATSPDAASDIDAPAKPWIDGQSATPALKSVQFTTSSFQVPFVVYARSTNGSTISARIRVSVEGIEQYNVQVLVPATPTQFLKIDRNNVRL